MKRAKNVGETTREQNYIRISHLTRLRCIYSLMCHVSPSMEPVNIPKEEYDPVMQTVAKWIERLE